MDIRFSGLSISNSKVSQAIMDSQADSRLSYQERVRRKYQLKEKNSNSVEVNNSLLAKGLQFDQIIEESKEYCDSSRVQN